MSSRLVIFLSRNLWVARVCAATGNHHRGFTESLNPAKADKIELSAQRAGGYLVQKSIRRKFSPWQRNPSPNP
jgi:hypothetical protein